VARPFNRRFGDPGLRHGFKSGLEDLNAKHLKSLGVTVKYESLVIPYVAPATLHTYRPDFPLPNGIIVETKGKFELQDRKKHLLVKSQHPKLDIRFVFSNPNARIYKGSPTTYAHWCERHGFKYAKKLIPAEWLKERGPGKVQLTPEAQLPKHEVGTKKR
jgi:hypothetical protein